MVAIEGGVIRTMDPALPVVGELAIHGDRIGGEQPARDAGVERVDLDGCCVVPGFTDSHVHFPSWSVVQRQLRLEGCRSLDDVVERIRAAAAETPPGRWLLGYGWRSGDWESVRDPSHVDLDPFTRDLPVALLSKDHHSFRAPTASCAEAAEWSRPTRTGSRRASCERRPPGTSVHAMYACRPTTTSTRRWPGYGPPTHAGSPRSTTRMAA